MGKPLNFSPKSDLEDCNRWPLGKLSSPHLPVDQGRQVRVGKQIDAILAARVQTGALCIHEGSFAALETDHELLAVEVTVPCKRQGRPYKTQPRVWIGGPDRIEGELTQERLVALSRRCTKPRASLAYKDPVEVKEALSRARQTKLGSDWTKGEEVEKA